MRIESDRLLITDLTMDMCEAIHQNSLDDATRRYVPDEVFETLEETQEIVEWLIKSADCSNGPFLYPILLKDQTNIGYVQTFPIKSDWELGCHIAKPYTGKGYAVEAVQAFLPVILTQLAVRKIYGIVLKENAAAHKVLLNCGFHEEFAGIERYQGSYRQLRRYVYEL